MNISLHIFRVPDLFWTVFEEIQFTTHIKIQGWICGVIFGLILIKTQNVRIIIPNVSEFYVAKQHKFYLAYCYNSIRLC